MSDTKLADLTALTTTSDDDLLYVVDDPAGTPADRKLALSDVFKRGTVTASSPVIDASQTWNASGVTFTGLRFNATDTASASGSLLMDLQVGGTSRLSVRKDGRIQGDGTSPYILLSTANGAEIGYSTNTKVLFGSSNVTFTGANFIYPSAATVNFALDTILTRRAAANLRLGAADAASPVAQTLSVQSVVAGTSNTAGANLTITGSQGTGTGAGGSIIFQVAPAGSSGTAQNALATALTINPNRSSAFSAQIQIDNGVNGTVYIGGNFGGVTNGASGMNYGNFNGFQTTGSYSWNTGTLDGTRDLFLARDAANTLALRNGANAQAFRVYNTFTSATDFERANIFWDSNVLKIGTEKGSGGGTARALELQTDGTTRLTIATNGDLTIADAENIILGTTTGTKIGTATTQKIGFYNATPVVQPTAVADATDAATVITQLNALLAHMRTLGLIAT